MTTDEFIVLCDEISSDSKLQIKPTFEEEKVSIPDRLADASLEQMPYREVLNLRTGFIYLSEIDDSRDYSTYFYILEKITEHFIASVKEVAAWSNRVWYDVIQFIKSLPEYHVRMPLCMRSSTSRNTSAPELQKDSGVLELL